MRKLHGSRLVQELLSSGSHFQCLCKLEPRRAAEIRARIRFIILLRAKALSNPSLKGAPRRRACNRLRSQQQLIA
ncbi:hypothetical protein NDU88_002229 [Pleurodeles waltl]|uniref:Uncharacterized protein n=1 Tax=Pleurodeles waltl TaxID=8319 RepID=A0AAV7SEW1_PLEWA|nr:hypothetical protein NDU88_002229 [Pleurodeles waltl]